MGYREYLIFLIDEAIRRRLEKRIYIPLPTEKGRLELFKINLRSVDLSNENGGIDWEYLTKVSEGYSGADITCVCREASMMPLRRKLASTGFDISNIAGMHEEIAIPLTMADFKEALKNIQKSVSQEQLTAYSDWMKTFGSV